MTQNIYSQSENEAQAPGQPEDDGFKSEVFENLRQGRQHRSAWRTIAREDFDFYAGVQWDETDSAKLADENRAAVVFNRILRTINSVCGLEIQNRQEVRYYPRNINPDDQTQDGLNDSGLSDMMNAASKWARDQTDAEDEESESFEDDLICGEGWTETRMDYEIDPQGRIVKDRIDPLEMLVDPTANKKNYENAKWIAHIKDYSREEVQAMFPDYDGSGGGTFWNDTEGQPHDAQDSWMYKNDQSDKLTQPGKISVIHYQYYKVEDYYLAVSKETQEIVEIPGDKYKANKQMIEALAAKVIKMKKRCYKRLFIVGDQFFDHDKIITNDYTFGAITGLRDRNRGYWFGLVSVMKDPQRWANKWLSQIQHIVNTSAKNALLVESGAVQNRRDLEDNLAKPGAIIDLHPGGLQRIQEMEKATTPEGVDRLLNYAMTAINDVPGVNLELIGMANRDQPMGLEMQRKQAGVTVLAKFFDSLRRYRKNDGRMLAAFIREYISDGRLIRVIGKTGAKYLPLMKDKLAMEYDIIVDDAPTSPNSKDRNFMILSQIVPMVMQAGIPVPPEILDYAPLPDDLIQKWKKSIQDANQPDPVQEELKQISLLMAKLQPLEKQAQIEKIGSETQKNMATAQKDASVGMEQEALAMQKMGMLNNDQQMKFSSMSQEQQRKDLEMMLNHYRKMLEIEYETKLKAKKMGAFPSLNAIN